MPRGLDHIVHAVHDLEAAAGFYRGIGFTVGARNRHAWGTHNHIVQFPGVFIELIAIGEPELIRIGAPGTFSFGAFTRDFLAREQGLAMLVLEGKGAADDAEAFRSAGIGDFKVFNFERDAKRPDGSLVPVAFSLAFAADIKAPDIGYFTCQQHHPENFWNPAFQQHANGVGGISGVILVAEEPQTHRHFLSAFSGVDEVKSGVSGIAVATPRGEIQIITPSAFRSHAGVEPPELARGARMAAIRFSGPNKALLTAALDKSGVGAAERNGNLVVPSALAAGATLIFEPVK